jgi:nucleoside-diphosphate-sugar epimerase
MQSHNVLFFGKLMATKNILLVGANGYIGRRFLERNAEKYNLKSIDNLLKPGKLPDYIENKDYRDLSEKYLNDFDVCLWLAGHSSVPSSIEDPYGAYQNNYSGMVELINKFNGLLIYASSASVYNNEAGAICNESTQIGDPDNVYDFTKVSFDSYVKIMNKKYVGLRFGTVDGGSPRIREELLLNRMVKDAMTTGTVNLANPKANRAVLYIEDLIDALELLLDSPPKSSEIYNLSSVNGNMENFVNTVAKKFNAKINLLENSNTYNFQMSTEKFSKHYNYKFTNDLELLVDNIIEFYKTKYNC